MRSLRTAFLLLVAVLCSGCQLRLAIDLDVDRNGGGNLALVVAADSELLQRARDAGADPLGDLVAAGEGLGEGWRVDDVTGGQGDRTVTLSAPFADPADLESLTGQLTEALAADEVVLLERLEVEVTDDQVVVGGVAGAELLPAVRDYGLSPKKAERLLVRNDALSYRVSVDPPGEVTAAEPAVAVADEQAPLAWSIAPGERVEFELTSTRPGRPIVPALLGGLAGLLLAWLVLRMIVVRRRNAARQQRRALAG